MLPEQEKNGCVCGSGEGTNDKMKPPPFPLRLSPPLSVQSSVILRVSLFPGGVTVRLGLLGNSMASPLMGALVVSQGWGGRAVGSVSAP